MKRKTPGI